MKYRSFILGWASVLAVTLLPGCAVHPQRAPSPRAASAAANADLDRASVDEAPLPSPLDIADGPRIKRVLVPGLHEPAASEPPLATLAEPHDLELLAPGEDEDLAVTEFFLLVVVVFWVCVCFGFGFCVCFVLCVRCVLFW